MAFGDIRVAERADWVIERMVALGTVVLRRIGETRSGEIAVHRFLSSPYVSTENIVTTCAARTAAQCRRRRILAVQDTSEINFAGRDKKRRGFGPAGNGKTPGFFIHPVIAVDVESEAVIGLVDAAIWTRREGKSPPRRDRPFEEKESARWLSGCTAAAQRLGEAAAVTMVADRESDIYTLFANRPPGVHLLCRSAQDRAITTGGLLAAHCDGLPEQGRETVAVAPKGSQTARMATVALRFDAISLKRRPGAAHAALPKTVSLWVVDVREVDPPAGAAPLHWRLLTTHAVTSLAEARRVLAWYRMRWTIEQVFRSLKSHCLRIEESQMEEARGFIKLAVVALIAAVRAMQLVLARDGSTGQPLTDAVDQADLPALRQINTSLEGRTLPLRNPHHPDLLAWYAWIVARLGGWSGYTSRGYKPPGPKTMHLGLRELKQILRGWRLANRSAHV